MAEAAPPAAPGCFVREDPPRTVVVDEPDLAALIHFHAGVAISDLVEEEAPAVGADDPDHLIDLVGSLLLQGEFVFLGMGSPCRAMPGRWSGEVQSCCRSRRPIQRTTVTALLLPIAL